MSLVYGVAFKDNGKQYYFRSDDLAIEKSDTVIVETEKGYQFGKVMSKNSDTEVEIDIKNMRDIVRKSTNEDYDTHLKNLRDAKKALDNARKFIDELELKMIMLDASFTFDRKQLLFNFTADERVDFRELAKKLANVYRTRIELRQIGARDKAKEIGGLGQCGMSLCCNRFLNRIDSITMNMAKNQNIALNPNKINGQCGRLLCCLTYENDEYLACSKGMPYVGQNVKIKEGNGRVFSVDILNRKYKVDVDGQKVEVELESCGKSN